MFWELDQRALDTEILKLTLQPLVENAVLHGLSPGRSKKDSACLTVTVRPQGTRTAIIIMDNGAGIAPEGLAAIETALEAARLGLPPDKPGADAHTGIPNVYQRLFGMALLSAITRILFCAP